MNEWKLCTQELPKYNKLVLFCFDTEDKTVFKGWLESKEGTPLGIDMWRIDGKAIWHKIEDVLAWYAFPKCQFLGSSRKDILSVLRTKLAYEMEVKYYES